MAGFPTKERQKIIDGYLAETGRNMFVPGEFIDWLSGQPDHVAYPWFFTKGDAEAAREYRIQLARQMASGLRIVAKTEDVKKAKVVGITVREYPAFMSPAAGRRSGGGYEPFDPKDAVQVAELKRQGIVALKSWLNRYQSVFGAASDPVFELVEALEKERLARSA